MSCLGCWFRRRVTRMSARRAALSTSIGWSPRWRSRSGAECRPCMRRDARQHISLRWRSRLDPSAEDLNPLLWPRSVTRHRTVLQTAQDPVTMQTKAEETTVRAAVVVEAPIEQAFAVFTEGIGTWFPAEYNLLKVNIAERVFE